MGASTKKRRARAHVDVADDVADDAQENAGELAELRRAVKRLNTGETARDVVVVEDAVAARDVSTVYSEVNAMLRALHFERVRRRRSGAQEEHEQQAGK